MPAGTYNAAYNTYGEFINDYRAEDPKVYLKDLSAYAGKTGDDGLLFRHACVMTAAHQLSGGDYNAPYNERAVVMESKRLMKAPEYRIACSDRNVLALANFGRLNDFEKVVSQVKGSFAAPEGKAELEDKAVEVKHCLKQLSGGRTGEEAEAYMKNQPRQLRSLYEEAEGYLDKCEKQIKDPRGKHISGEDSMKLFSASADYMEGREVKGEFADEQMQFKASVTLSKVSTADTQAERFYHNQVKHIKKVREEDALRQEAPAQEKNKELEKSSGISL